MRDVGWEGCRTGGVWLEGCSTREMQDRWDARLKDAGQAGPKTGGIHKCSDAGLKKCRTE